MEITLRHVADCPNLALARDRVIVAAEQAGLEVTIDEQLVRDPFEAARTGLTGSPTILIDGADPFATAGATLSVVCRLYRTSDGVQGAPTVEA